MLIEQSRIFRRFLVCSWHRGGMGSSAVVLKMCRQVVQAGGAGDAEAWEEVQETTVGLEGWEEDAEDPTKEGPVQGPWEVSSVVAELPLPLPVPLVGVTSLGGKAGGPLIAFDVEGEDILLSPPPASNKFISLSSSSSWSSSQGNLVSTP
jgi:hypothetical protein